MKNNQECPHCHSKNTTEVEDMVLCLNCLKMFETDKSKPGPFSKIAASNRFEVLAILDYLESIE